MRVRRLPLALTVGSWIVELTQGASVANRNDLPSATFKTSLIS